MIVLVLLSMPIILQETSTTITNQEAIIKLIEKVRNLENRVVALEKLNKSLVSENKKLSQSNNQTYTVKVKVGMANLRECPSKDCKIIRVRKNSDVLEAVGAKGTKWTQLKDGTFISNKLISEVTL